MRLLAAGALVGALVLTGCGGGDSSASGSASATPSAEGGGVSLLEQQRTTVLDQPVQYPKKRPAEITSATVLLEPGQESGWRKHGAPTYVYVMEGTITVEYDAGVTQEFSAGTSFMQAVGVWHNISNKGSDAARFLTVTMGAKGIKPVVER